MTPTEARKLWAEALRSGQYKQCQGSLCKTDVLRATYCCLGVACELYQKHVGGLDIRDSAIGVRYYNNQDGALPDVVRNWLGLSDIYGRLKKDFRDDKLSNMNDNGVSFEKIAEHIENDLVECHD